MIEPGYYWIRWPRSRGGQRWMAEWLLSAVEWLDGELVAYLPGNDGSFPIDDAELGPRIEPPSDNGSGL